MKKITLTLSLIPFFCCCGIVLLAQTGAQKVLVTDLTKVKQITSVVASPDGRKAVYTLKTIEPNADNKLEYDYRTHLYLVDLQNSKLPIALTHGSESISSPVFSPDGKSIAFVRNVKGKGQIFILPLDGGEAWQLTDDAYGAGNPKFSPDGTKILYGFTTSLTALLADTVLNAMHNIPTWSLEKPGFPKNEFLNRDKK